MGWTQTQRMQSKSTCPTGNALASYDLLDVTWNGRLKTVRQKVSRDWDVCALTVAVHVVYSVCDWEPASTNLIKFCKVPDYRGPRTWWPYGSYLGKIEDSPSESNWDERVSQIWNTQPRRKYHDPDFPLNYSSTAMKSQLDECCMKVLEINYLDWKVVSVGEWKWECCKTSIEIPRRGSWPCVTLKARLYKLPIVNTSFVDDLVFASDFTHFQRVIQEKQ